MTDLNRPSSRRHRRVFFRRVVATALGVGALVFGGWLGGRGSRPLVRPNVLLLTIDTLRADHLSAWGYPRATSPNLDRLAAEGVRFEKAQVQWPKTSPSFASMLTATYPKDNGVVRQVGNPISCGLRTLAEELRSHGYTTHAVVANGAVGREFRFDQGFDRYVEAWKGAEGEEAIEIATRPDHVTDLALETLASIADDGRPWLLWVHYLDPHFPYRPPEPWRDEFQHDAHYRSEPRIEIDSTKQQRVTGAIGRQQVLDGRDELGFYVARYDAELRFTDHEIGRLVAALEARGDWQRMLTVFTADHGESLGEHDYYFDHGLLPFQDVLHVPFAIRLPGTIGPAIDPHPVEVLNLAPTVLDYLGLPLAAGAGWGQGRSLRGRIEGRESGEGTIAFSEAGYAMKRRWMKTAFDGRLKLVWAPTAADRRRLAPGPLPDRVLYDLLNDPGETVDVSDKFPAELDRLSRRLWAWFEAPPFRVHREPEACGEERETDPATLEQLKALGYI